MSENGQMRNQTIEEMESFTRYVTQLKQGMKRQYDRNVNKDLSSQNWNELLKRNVVAVLQQVYQESLLQLQATPVPSRKALQPYDGMVDDLLQYALHKHRTSCALSNFPDEHRPSETYINEAIHQTSQDWQVFAAQVTRLLTTA